jgi:two-component system phosphate regulon sensor histidine kinase PhoR
LFNFIGNSCKFTFNGFIKIKISSDNNSLISEIEDSGIGIKSEDLNKLFKFFGKLSDPLNINKGGMGLGLTISKMIIDSMNGDLIVKSEY